MKLNIKWIVSLMMIVACGQCYAWTDLGGGDHGGSNWVIAGGSSIASNHYRIGMMTISSGVTVSVKSWDGSKYGGVSISATDMRIDGVLDASGAGYAGGNGGNGGFGSASIGASGGSGVAGSPGSGPFGGSGGVSGSGGYDSGNPGVTRPGWPGGYGGMGGYATNGMQGDTTTNDAVFMGGGGGGGAGGGAGWNLQGTTSGGGGGGGGNPGGGWIKLYATNTIIVRGTLQAKGLAGARQNGGTGQTQMPAAQGGNLGSATSAGQSLGGMGGASIPAQCYPAGLGGNGGAGAGGGILLQASTVDTLGGNLDNRGGGNSLVNGGTLKIIYITLQGGSYTNTGRTYLQQLLPPEPGTVFEF